MSRLAALKSTVTRDDVAALLHTSLQGLTSILYSKPIANRYTTFEIPKRGGGTRVIKAPDEKLKLLQQKLSMLLQDCLDELSAAKQRKHPVACGFRRKCSIKDNAKRHRNRRWVFSIDLQDFFPSINFGRVRGFLIHDRNFELKPDVATVLAQIACDGNALPQGSPCSPVISNLIAHVLDMHIVRLASQVGCTYSRYADDLTFSTNKKDFPTEIAYQAHAQTHWWLPGVQLEEIVSHSGFTINPTKTRMQYRNSRQDVTGLIVNKKINIRKEYRHTVRAMVHRLFSTGQFELPTAVVKDGTTTLEMREGKLDELHGRLGFIDWIDVYNKRIADRKEDPDHLSTKESMYRQFIIYRDFYTAHKPVILCEGKTDSIYLKYAIRSLAPQFPDLAEIDDKGRIRLKVRLYRYTKSSTSRILGLADGGTSHMPKFIGNYKKETDKFNAPGLQNPLIILFDNDSGSKPICNAVQQARPGSKPMNLGDIFTHAVKNLYVVPTPLLPNKSQSKIEDFFDPATLGMKVGGKTFTDQNKFDATLYYGKAIFAEAVVKAHAHTIDFSGFVPLLTNICSVIQSHAQKVANAAKVPQPQA